MTDSLRLEGGGKVIDLYSWLAPKAKGFEALAGILGFGLPGVTNQWFEGAGHGSTWRGARVGRRVISIPLWVYAENRAELSKQVSELAIALDPVNGESRLYFGLPDDAEWFVDVVRTGGGDWARKVDSDDRTYFKTSLTLEAGDPFWTRNLPESFEVRRGASGTTLLPRLAKLRVGSGAAFGVQDVENIGDTFAWPVIRVDGPTTKVTLIGAKGETVVWNSAIDSYGALLAGQSIYFDMRHSIVIDNLDQNRYGGLQTAPRFWSIAPGDSQVTVQADNTDTTTIVFAQWWPRRWAAV